MQSFRVTLNDVAENQAAIEAMEINDRIKLYGSRTDERYWLVTDVDENELGTLPRRGKLMDAIVNGGEMVSVRLQRISPPTDAKPHFAVGVEVDVELADCEEEESAASSVKTYRVGIVGESNYQAEIARCAAGETVQIAHERGNPYDAAAIAVLNARGERIGYIGRDHWLRDAIEEGKGCSATIEEIKADPTSGRHGVVLMVMLDGSRIESVAYDRPAAAASMLERATIAAPAPPAPAASPRDDAPQKRSWFSRLFGL